MAVFWDVPPCRLADVHRRFRGAYCLHHQGDERLMMEAVSSSETLVNIYQTTWYNIPEEGIFIFVAVRTSNLTSLSLFALPRHC
jgi:hypothetical protein